MSACSGNKNLANQINDDNKSEKTSQEDDLKLTYGASTRGYFMQISVTKNTTTYQLDRNDKPVTIPTNKKDWNELMETLKEIDAKSITTLEAPSKARQYDGAAHASFSIQNNQDKPYNAPSFDAGNPHKLIAPTVNKLISLIPSKK